jgi:hypothetical protein
MLTEKYFVLTTEAAAKSVAHAQKRQLNVRSLQRSFAVSIDSALPLQCLPD